MWPRLPQRACWVVCLCNEVCRQNLRTRQEGLAEAVVIVSNRDGYNRTLVCHLSDAHSAEAQCIATIFA
jgi:hypothetical protein